LKVIHAQQNKGILGLYGHAPFSPSILLELAKRLGIDCKKSEILNFNHNAIIECTDHIHTAFYHYVIAGRIFKEILKKDFHETINFMRPVTEIYPFAFITWNRKYKNLIKSWQQANANRIYIVFGHTTVPQSTEYQNIVALDRSFGKVMPTSVQQFWDESSLVPKNILCTGPTMYFALMVEKNPDPLMAFLESTLPRVISPNSYGLK
jgi:hypothetical protein